MHVYAVTQIYIEAVTNLHTHIYAQDVLLCSLSCARLANFFALPVFGQSASVMK